MKITKKSKSAGGGTKAVRPGAKRSAETGAKKGTKTAAKMAARKPRADAQRNRERILAVAKEAFARSGSEPSMDEVARLAGVGPGTLYRNFPSRDALIEALYRAEVEKLGEAARELSARLAPGEALRAWLLMLIEYMGAKRLYMPAMQTMVCGTEDVFAASGTVLLGALELLGRRAVEAGVMRADMEAMDLALAIFGVGYAGPAADWQPRARRMVDVLLAGAAPRA